MLYIERDLNGKIIGIHNEPTQDAHEAKTVMDSEVIEFLNSTGLKESWKPVFNILDQNLIRVLDDLVDLLVEKKVILFTDLPYEAQEKIKERKVIRKKLKNSEFIVDDNDIL